MTVHPALVHHPDPADLGKKITQKGIFGIEHI